MDFLQPFADFVQHYMERYDRQHLLGNPEYKHTVEAMARLRKVVAECMMPGTEEVLDLYSEAKNSLSFMDAQVAFMAGFKLALELLVLANNPQPLISPPWGETSWDNAVRRAEEILQKARQGKLISIGGQRHEG